MFNVISDGAVELFFNNSLKLTTASDGIDVTGDVGGTTIGGITESNLLDKTAAETISGDWTFDTHLEADSFGTIAISIADDATATFTVGVHAVVMVLTNFTETANVASMIVAQNTPLHFITLGAAASYGNSTNPDVDGDANYWKSSSTVLSIKNRLGSTRTFTVITFIN